MDSFFFPELGPFVSSSIFLNEEGLVMEISREDSEIPTHNLVEFGRISFTFEFTSSGIF